MSSLLVTANAVEDNVLDSLNMVEDRVLRTARLFAEAFEPITKLMPTLPRVDMVPSATEIVDHSYGFVDRLTANLRDFNNKFLEVLPIDVEAAAPKVARASSKAQAA